MIAVVFGGASSGKSSFAQEIALRAAKKPPVYLATMINSGGEDEKIINRHRAMRKGLGFVTVEKPEALYRSKLSGADTVLLEDLSNLAANEFFYHGSIRTPQEAFGEIKKGIDFLSVSVSCLVIVTSDVFSDGCVYDELTESYLKILAQANKYAALCCDVFVQMQSGLKLFYKGSEEMLSGKCDI